ncbi:agmatinase [Candidatus Magnetomorum sp. HK-1]|nr:agmatinase [Candidatus Magnetomorum sp. HK-1]
MIKDAKKYLGFLSSEIGYPFPETCLFHIIPAGYEASVSYGTGTKNGPKAIIEASQQLELFNGHSVPADKGIYTHPPLLFNKSCEENIFLIENTVSSVLKKNKIPVILGGEHTVSVGAFRALSKMKDRIGIIQLDAHADLRDSYEGNKYSHACVMKRALDHNFSIAQFGIRSLSYDEHLLRKEKNIFHIDADIFAEQDIPKHILPDLFPENIYITFDVDCLDPSVISSTGTPVPGGLLWYQALNLLKKITKDRNIVGFDVVELAPIAMHHASDFATARLVYEIMGMVSQEFRIQS